MGSILDSPAAAVLLLLVIAAVWGLWLLIRSAVRAGSKPSYDKMGFPRNDETAPPDP